MIRDCTNDTFPLFINLYGKFFKVMAFATTDEEANAYMTANDGASCIAVMKDDLVVIAHKHDKGIPA